MNGIVPEDIRESSSREPINYLPTDFESSTYQHWKAKGAIFSFGCCKMQERFSKGKSS